MKAAFMALSPARRQQPHRAVKNAASRAIETSTNSEETGAMMCQNNRPSRTSRSPTGALPSKTRTSPRLSNKASLKGPPAIMTLPNEVLDYVLSMIDTKSLTAFSLCSRECLHVPTDALWQNLHKSHDWLIRRKPSQLSWKAFAQRLDAAYSEPEKSGRMIIIGGSATHHHPLRRLESLADLGESLRGKGPGPTKPRTPLHKVKAETELREAVSAPGVTVDDYGRVIVVGGWSGYQAIRRVDRLDTVTGEWQAMPALEHRRCFLASATDHDGNHYALGGGSSVWRGATVYSTVEIMRATDGARWSSDFPSMLVPRCGHQAAITDLGLLYVAGGYGGGTNYLSSMEWMEPERGWQMAPNMAHYRSGLGFCFGPDRCLYAVGGSQDGVTSTSHAERYDPRCGKWVELAPMPVARGYCAAAFGLSGQLYVTGGQKSFANPPRLSNNVDIFDIRMDKWFTGPAVPGRLDLGMAYSLPL